MTLEEAMTAKGFNDATLAEKVGVTRPTITKLRRGDRKPSIDLAAKIERLTGFPAASFAEAS